MGGSAGSSSPGGPSANPPTKDGRWVLHSLQRWLPLSEQFVHSLVTHSRHPGLVIARDTLVNTEVFPHRPVRSLGIVSTSLPEKMQRRLVTAGFFALSAPYRLALVHHHHGYGASGLIGFLRRRKLPFVLSLHGEDVTAYSQKNPGYLAGVLDAADVVVVPSRFLLERATVDIGARRESLVVAPSGVDTGFFAPTPLPLDKPEAVFIGRFVEKKGIDVLLAAWPAVRSRVPSATLRLVGFGPLEELARSAGDGVMVELAEPRRRADQVRQAIRRSRVVVTPSRTAADGDAESLLLVNLEAQSSGRPLVTTRHGGIPEFVDDGRTALVVPEGDPDALAEAMVELLSDDELASRMASAGEQWAKQFDVGICTARIDDIYDRLAEAA